MTSKPGDVVNSDGAISIRAFPGGDFEMLAVSGRVQMTPEQAECAKWFGWELVEHGFDDPLDLVVMERKRPNDMRIARTLLRVWPKKNPTMMILARPYQGTPRPATYNEREREMLGLLVGIDHCAMAMSGLGGDDRVRKILTEAGPNTLDLVAGTF